MSKFEKKQGFRVVYDDPYTYFGEPQYIAVTTLPKRLRSRRNEVDVIFWDDILMAFKDADRIQLGDTVIPFVRDLEDYNVLEPKRISAYPDVILDVKMKRSPVGESIRSFGMSASSSTSDRSVLVSSPTQEISRSSSATSVSEKGYDRRSGSGHSFHDYSTSYSRPTSPQSPKFNHPPISRHSIHGETVGNHNNHSVYFHSAPIGNARDFAVENPSSRFDSFSRGGQRERYMSQEYTITSPESIPIDFIQSKSDQGYREEQNLLGKLYESNPSVGIDYMKALEWYLRSAEQGYSHAQNNLGLMYFEGKGVPQNYTQAKIWFELAASQNHPDALNNIGRLYDNGLGVPKDFFKAKDFFERAEIQGHTDASTNLGIMYEFGKGQKRDYMEAKRYYVKASSKGCLIAETRMGKLYCQQWKDYKKALECFRNSARRNHAPAMEMLGKMHYHGWGVPRNFVMSMDWYQKAADNGQSSAHNILGTMYLRGEGCPKDFIKATEHYSKAAIQGDSTGVDNLQYSRQKKYLLKTWCSM